MAEPSASNSSPTRCALVGCSMAGSVELEIESSELEPTARRLVITICERHLSELCAARRAAPDATPVTPEVESPRRRFRRR